MKDVEIKLVTQNQAAVKGLREVAAESEKLHTNTEKRQKRQIGLIADIEKSLASLQEGQKKAMTIEHIQKYNQKIAEAKKELDAYNKAGIEGNKQVEKSTDGLINKIGKMALAYLSVKTAIALAKETVLAFFTKSQEGIDLVERKVAGLKAAWAVLSGEFVAGGKKMANAFDEPEKKVSRFWSFLMLSFGPAWAHVGVQMDAATVAAEKYTQALQDIAYAESDLIVPRAKANAEIIKARLIYADLDRSAEERVAALEKAFKLEQETAEAEIKHQQWVILTLRDINEEKRKTGQLRREDLEAMEKALAREIELQSESEQRQVRAFRNLMTLKKEINDKANEEIKKAQDAFNKYWDKVDKEEFERLKKEAEDKWKFELEYGKKLFEQNKKQAEQEWDLMEERNKAQKKAEKELLEMRKQSLLSMGESVKDFISIMDNLSRKEVDRVQRERELLDTRISETQSALNTEVQLHKQGYASNIDAKKKELEELKKQRDAALLEEEKARKKQHQIEVASLLAQKAVDVAKIISSTAVANAKAIALSPLTFGQPWVGINTAAAALGIAAAAAAVIAASSAKYAKGGWTGEGKYRDSTGERMAGIVHEKEFVVRRGPAHKFRDVLEAINKDDRRMVMKSFNKIMPGSNNILIENNGPNKRLDEVNSNLRQIRSKEEIIVLNGMTVYKKGNSVRVIKK